MSRIFRWVVTLLVLGLAFARGISVAGAWQPSPDSLELAPSVSATADGGALAVWGATGLGIATGHQLLAQGFLASVFQRHEGTIGADTLSGKLQIEQRAAYAKHRTTKIARLIYEAALLPSKAWRLR